jgi:tetratricopeptide (TPR) repeat protein
MTSSINKVIAVGIATGWALPSFAAAFEDGIQQYGQGHYQEAVLALSRAEAADPRNASVHYYLANTFVYLKRHRDAIGEYRICYALDPAGSTSQFCVAALNGYHQATPDECERRRICATICSAAPSAPVDHALSVIRRQAEIEKKKHESASEATAQDALSTAQKAAKTVQEDAEQQVQRLYAPQPRRLAYTGDLQAREVQIRTQAKEEQEWILRQAQQRADHYRLVADMQKSALDQVADNLEQQLSDDGTRSGIKLIPSGTNLYVRSYASVRSPKAAPDAHAAVARIYGQHSEGPSADGQQGDSHAERSVHGKLVQPSSR